MLETDVRYDIGVCQEYDERRLLSGQQTRTPTSQNTHLSINPFIAADRGERLTLHMSNSRKLDFFPVSHGECKAHGGFRRKSPQSRSCTSGRIA